jgi:hypothetical protein
MIENSVVEHQRKYRKPSRTTQRQRRGECAMCSAAADQFIGYAFYRLSIS